jgi:hypothetical protein
MKAVNAVTGSWPGLRAGCPSFAAVAEAELDARAVRGWPRSDGGCFLAVHAFRRREERRLLSAA